MPVHDWTRVEAGTYHDFHGAWIVHLKETLNSGLLPEGFYALAGQHAGRVITDVLTLQAGERSPPPLGRSGSAVAEAPPRVSRKMVASDNSVYRRLRRTLAVRHVSNHQLVAMIEVLSPANKDRETSVRDFVEKVISTLRVGCHVVVIDLFAPGTYDRHGIHGAIWEHFDPVDYVPPPDKPMTQAAYCATPMPVAYLEPIAIGDQMPSMPLYLEVDWHIDLPLESTYEAAYQGVPAFYRGILERSTF
jgi:hypothetical protein